MSPPSNENRADNHTPADREMGATSAATSAAASAATVPGSPRGRKMTNTSKCPGAPLRRPKRLYRSIPPLQLGN